MYDLLLGSPARCCIHTYIYTYTKYILILYTHMNIYVYTHYTCVYVSCSMLSGAPAGCSRMSSMNVSSRLSCFFVLMLSALMLCVLCVLLFVCLLLVIMLCIICLYSLLLFIDVHFVYSRLSFLSIVPRAPRVSPIYVCIYIYVYVCCIRVCIYIYIYICLQGRWHDRGPAAS